MSGTALDTFLVRRLNDGDPGGHLRRAFSAFPMPSFAKQVLDAHFRPKGRGGTPYSPLKQLTLKMDHHRQRLLVLASFAEVFLAREGHEGHVGMNLLTKIQLPNLATVYGAMLAGVAYVLMGAGVPRDMPGALDQLSEHRPASTRVDVMGSNAGDHETLTFTPKDLWDCAPTEAPRPNFLPIVASNSLATVMARKSTGRIDGFIIEGPTAGGHNAPPRGARKSNERGEPLYGDRDVVDLRRVADLGLPFWVAGSAGSPERLAEARDQGAAGIQVGTLFAYTEESGLDPSLKARVIQQAIRGDTHVFSDGRASPTGFPFKVVSIGDSLSEDDVYERRARICDVGYLRLPYRREDGTVGFRCAAEPVEAFVRKGGDRADTVGRKCLCNALASDCGVGQDRGGAAGQEPPLLTSGEYLSRLGDFLGQRTTYSADDVLDYLLGTPAG